MKKLQTMMMQLTRKQNKDINCTPEFMNDFMMQVSPIFQMTF